MGPIPRNLIPASRLFIGAVGEAFRPDVPGLLLLGRKANR